MKKQPSLPTILKSLIDTAIFTIDYGISFDNGDGTYTLGGICDIHNVQPNSTLTVNGIDYNVNDYLAFGGGWKIILDSGTNPLPPNTGTITLRAPWFIHGTPIQANVEQKKELLDVRTPMIYLIEPFDTELDYSVESNIASTSTFTLCFLGQAEVQKRTTDELYHNAVDPMYRMAQDFIQHLINSYQFNTVNLTASPTFYTKFGINIKDEGTKKLLFSEDLSGVGLKLTIEVYKDNSCCGEGLITFTDIELREDNSIEKRDITGIELRN